MFFFTFIYNEKIKRLTHAYADILLFLVDYINIEFAVKSCKLKINFRMYITFSTELSSDFLKHFK